MVYLKCNSDLTLSYLNVYQWLAFIYEVRLTLMSSGWQSSPIPAPACLSRSMPHHPLFCILLIWKPCSSAPFMLFNDYALLMLFPLSRILYFSSLCASFSCVLPNPAYTSCPIGDFLLGSVQACFTPVITSYFKFFLMFIYYWETETEHEQGRGREKGRHRIWSRFQAQSCQHKAWHGAQTHNLRDHDLSQSQTQLTEPPRRPWLDVRLKVKCTCIITCQVKL